MQSYFTLWIIGVDTVESITHTYGTQPLLWTVINNLMDKLNRHHLQFCVWVSRRSKEKIKCHLDTWRKLHSCLPGVEKDRHQLQPDSGVGGCPFQLRLHGRLVFDYKCPKEQRIQLPDKVLVIPVNDTTKLSKLTVSWWSHTMSGVSSCYCEMNCNVHLRQESSSKELDNSSLGHLNSLRWWNGVTWIQRWKQELRGSPYQMIHWGFLSLILPDAKRSK